MKRYQLQDPTGQHTGIRTDAEDARLERADDHPYLATYGPSCGHCGKTFDQHVNKTVQMDGPE